MDGWVGGVQTNCFMISRLSGPWTARLWSWSVEGLIQTLRPSRSASSRSQTPSYSSPPTKRKLSWPRRKTVASSIIPPVSLQTAV